MVQSPEETNQTIVTEFVLLGFQASKNVRTFIFSLLFVVYCGTICGNLLIITLVSTSKNLHTPMYFFISQLAISDIVLPTDIVPNMFYMLLNNGGEITYTGCITQLYFFSVSEGLECLLLTVMSYDRYVAICNPLHYISIMTNPYCVKLVMICWLASLSMTLTYDTQVSMLLFCGQNIIDHFFCDILPLLEISCSDTSIVRQQIYLLSIPLIITPTIIIIISYTKIISSILRIPSTTGRQKAFSTCSSHLIVVSIFYWTIFCVYILATKGKSSTIGKIPSLLYIVFTPMINPIVYSLKNKDIMKAIRDTIKKIWCYLNAQIGRFGISDEGICWWASSVPELESEERRLLNPSVPIRHFRSDECVSEPTWNAEQSNSRDAGSQRSSDIFKQPIGTYEEKVVNCEGI
ncbi:olfactory receptor 1496-like [Bufo gargarizans]|uniref:olfactory receptor 1496-like n=1 Tax=Bufo gargarizans TaxID=30331 RepID=UPI001CF1BB63|nr:olfactory receptor 1496-like [Bufo gargarizans]